MSIVSCDVSADDSLRLSRNASNVGQQTNRMGLVSDWFGPTVLQTGCSNSCSFFDCYFHMLDLDKLVLVLVLDTQELVSDTHLDRLPKR